MDFFQRNIFLKRKENYIPLHLQLQFLKRLYRLLNNGYSLIESLQLIKLEQDLEIISKRIEKELIQGNSLAIALEKVNFHSSITGFLHSVEPTGHITKHIQTCVQLTQQRLNYVKKLQQVTRYPIVLAILFFGIFLLIYQFVLPSFERILSTQNNLFIKTNIFINTIKILGFIILSSAIIGMCLYLCRNYFQTMFSIDQKINILTKFPLVNKFITLHLTFLFSTQLSVLIQSGMTLRHILSHLSEQQQTPILSHYSFLLMKEFQKGGDFILLLKSLPLIDAQLALLFKNNSNMKDLARDLSMYGEIIFDEFERNMVKVISLIQPIFFLILALFIILMYLAIMFPMFDLINHF